MKTDMTFLVRMIKEDGELIVTTMLPDSHGCDGTVSSFCYDYPASCGDLVCAAQELADSMAPTFIFELLSLIDEREKYLKLLEETGNLEPPFFYDSPVAETKQSGQ